jgi:hypothetical protein
MTRTKPSEKLRKRRSNDVRRLRRRIEDELLGLPVPVAERALPLHRGHALACQPDLPFDHDRRGLSGVIEFRIQLRCKEQIVTELLVNEWRTRPATFDRIDHRWQLFQLGHHEPA